MAGILKISADKFYSEQSSVEYILAWYMECKRNFTKLGDKKLVLNLLNIYHDVWEISVDEITQ